MRAADGVRRELRGALAALAFLTRLPLGRLAVLDGADLARGVVAFPLIGVLVGAAAGGAGALVSPQLAPGLAGATGLTVAVLLTGALHIDGLADTADALGARSRDRALEIMRESLVGSYGVVAVGLLLIAEANALALLVAVGRTAAVASAFALSRAVAPVIAAALPYARPAAGLGAALESVDRKRVCAVVLIAVGVAAALDPGSALAMTACAAVCAVASGAVFRRRFGGMTGDTLGCAIAATEVLCLILASAS